MDRAINCDTQQKPKVLPNSKRKISILSVFCLALGRMIGVRCKYWNRGLVIDLDYIFGFGAIYSVMIIILACSLAEMTGALPFTGGTYGFARGIYGPYLGFIVGILEILTSIACLAAFLHGFGEACVTAARLSGGYVVVFFFLLIGSTAVAQSLDTYRFAMFIRVFTLVATALSIIYLLGATPSLNLDKYSREHSLDPFHHSWRDILANSPAPAFFFTGIEMLPIIAHDAREPRRAVPMGLVVVSITSVIVAFLTYTVACGQPPGIGVLETARLPLTYGFANLFHMTPETAMIFNIPFQISSFMISQYFLCIIMKSMAESGLLPSYFLHTATWPKYDLVFPVYSASLSFALAAFAAGLAYLMTGISDSLQMNFVFFFSFPYYTLYIALFVTFITFRQHFSSLPRSFVSPFGIYGAYLGIAITVFYIMATCFYSFNVVAFAVYLLFLLAISMYYLHYVHHHETFSGEEERVFFLTYVIRSNQSHQRKLKKAAMSMRQGQGLLSSIHGSNSPCNSPIHRKSTASGGGNSPKTSDHYVSSWSEHLVGGVFASYARSVGFASGPPSPVHRSHPSKSPPTKAAAFGASLVATGATAPSAHSQSLAATTSIAGSLSPVNTHEDAVMLWDPSTDVEFNDARRSTSSRPLFSEPSVVRRVVPVTGISVIDLENHPQLPMDDSEEASSSSSTGAAAAGGPSRTTNALHSVPLTFEEALASSEDAKLLYIRQHLEQHQLRQLRHRTQQASRVLEDAEHGNGTGGMATATAATATAADGRDNGLFAPLPSATSQRAGGAPFFATSFISRGGFSGGLVSRASSSRSNASNQSTASQSLAGGLGLWRLPYFATSNAALGAAPPQHRPSIFAALWKGTTFQPHTTASAVPTDDRLPRREVSLVTVTPSAAGGYEASSMATNMKIHPLEASTEEVTYNRTYATVARSSTDRLLEAADDEVRDFHDVTTTEI